MSSKCGDMGDWEVVDQTDVAVDYSNVQVFIKTLQEWQKMKNNDDLQINFDEALCEQAFAAADSQLRLSEIGDKLFKGGYISLDAVDSQSVNQQQHSASPVKVGHKRTWYKSEIEPCVGTSLFFEVPITQKTTAESK